MTAGQRVRLTEDVDRFPFFIARKGATGTYLGHWKEGGGESIQMDATLENCEDWANRLEFHEGTEAVEDCTEPLLTFDVRGIPVTFTEEPAQ